MVGLLKIIQRQLEGKIQDSENGGGGGGGHDVIPK